MTFEERDNVRCGNLLLSYGVKEDKAADAKGYKFLGVAKDSSGNEVHIFEMQDIDSFDGK